MGSLGCSCWSLGSGAARRDSRAALEPSRGSASTRVDVDIIAVPYDSGHRDARMGRGPGHLLASGIVEALERSGASVRVTEVSLPENKFETEASSAFALQAMVADRVSKARREGSLPIVLSGNCNTAVGTVAGITSSTGAVPAVCWLDAHADFNTPDTTTSGFLDGMAVSMLTGRSWTSMTATIPGFIPVDESRILMIGVRDIDGLEKENLDASLVTRAPPDFNEGHLGILASLPESSLYLHVDLDVFDVTEGHANSYAVEGGLTRDGFLRLARVVASRRLLSGAALTAYDPSCDPDNRIAQLAIHIAVVLATGAGLGS